MQVQRANPKRLIAAAVFVVGALLAGAATAEAAPAAPVLKVTSTEDVLGLSSRLVFSTVKAAATPARTFTVANTGQRRAQGHRPHHHRRQPRAVQAPLGAGDRLHGQPGQDRHRRRAVQADRHRREERDAHGQEQRPGAAELRRRPPRRERGRRQGQERGQPGQHRLDPRVHDQGRVLDRAAGQDPAAGGRRGRSRRTSGGSTRAEAGPPRARRPLRLRRQPEPARPGTSPCRDRRRPSTSSPSRTTCSTRRAGPTRPSTSRTRRPSPPSPPAAPPASSRPRRSPSRPRAPRPPTTSSTGLPTASPPTAASAATRPRAAPVRSSRTAGSSRSTPRTRPTRTSTTRTSSSSSRTPRPPSPRPRPRCRSGSTAPLAATVADRDGEGTGFASVQPNAAGDQHQPAALDLTSGTLRVTSGAGTNEGSSDTQANALTTARRRQPVEHGGPGPPGRPARRSDRAPGSARASGSGPGADDHVSAVVERRADGTYVTMRAEQAGVSQVIGELAAHRTGRHPRPRHHGRPRGRHACRDRSGSTARTRPPSSAPPSCPST